MKKFPVGVIIPAYREGNRVVEQVAHLRYGGFDGPIVVSLVEGDDATEPPPGVAMAVGVAGRGGQMNRGAALVDADTLLFLHADTQVDPAVVASLGSILDQAEAVAGAFTLRFDAQGIGYRIVERGAALRCRLFSLPYGDQAIFVRREVFEQVGGYPDIPLMEEVGLLDRLRPVGKIVILPDKAVTSARRYEKRGIVPTTWRNLRTLAAYRFGVDPMRLYDRYYGD